ncbi:MAG: pyridoxal phosphate-dependent aminotransferase [Rhodobacteraceae bacterium]|nr:pyridoxal phosphate-dependent aminotransferase [Paracoccaceae bacterium]
MRASKRIENLLAGGGDGWALFFRARQMVAEGQPVTELTIGEHDIRTDPSILAAMGRAAEAGHTGYSAIPGTDRLRDLVARRVSERTGVPTNRENVLIVPGGQSGLFAAHHATLDEGDTALFIDPYYATYPGTIRGVGARPLAVKALPEDGFQPRASAIAAVAAEAKTLLINSPNNPTGAVYTRQTLEGIAEVAKAHDLWVISDEVYDTQIWNGEHVSIRSLPGMDERTLVIGSMSKSHAMTGSRIGWIVGPEAIIGLLTTLSTHTTYGVAGFIQDAASFALEEGPKLEAEIAAPFARRRKIALDLLAQQNRIKAIPPDGAMYMMLDMRATGLSGETFANRLLDEELIAVMPGEIFGQAAAGHIRMALTIPDEAFGKAFERLLTFANAI